QIMGRQILHHAHVPNTVGESTLPAGRDLVDLPQLAIGDALAQRLQRRVVPLHVSDRAHKGSLLEGPSDLCGLSDVEGERLLDQAMDPRFSKGQCDIVMELSGYGDDRIVDSRV